MPHPEAEGAAARFWYKIIALMLAAHFVALAVTYSFAPDQLSLHIGRSGAVTTGAKNPITWFLLWVISVGTVALLITTTELAARHPELWTGRTAHSYTAASEADRGRMREHCRMIGIIAAAGMILLFAALNVMFARWAIK